MFDGFVFDEPPAKSTSPADDALLAPALLPSLLWSSLTRGRFDDGWDCWGFPIILASAAACFCFSASCLALSALVFRPAGFAPALGFDPLFRPPMRSVGVLDGKVVVLSVLVFLRNHASRRPTPAVSRPYRGVCVDQS